MSQFIIYKGLLLKKGIKLSWKELEDQVLYNEVIDCIQEPNTLQEMVLSQTGIYSLQPKDVKKLSSSKVLIFF